MTTDAQATFQRRTRCSWPSNVRPGLICTWPYSEVESGREHGPAFATDGHLCPGHYARLARLISEIPIARTMMLANLRPNGAQTDGERVSGSGGMQDAIRVNVLDIADRLSDAIGWTPAMVAYRADCATICDHIAKLISSAHAIAPWREGRRRVPIRCPHCGMSTIYAADGEEDGRCARKAGGCGLVITADEIYRIMGIEPPLEEIPEPRSHMTHVVPAPEPVMSSSPATEPRCEREDLPIIMCAHCRECA